MDSSLQNAHLTVDAPDASLATIHETAEGTGEEHHIHLPNPSWWPLLLGAAILVAVVGLLFIPDNPWITIVAAPFVLIGILGWALEDPMAAPKGRFYTSKEAARSKFKIGQDVVDKDGRWIGVVQARFPHYILVDTGSLFGKAFYVPHRLIEDEIKDNVVRLNESEAALEHRGLDVVPEDLYENPPEFGVPQVKGVPLFARRPLSPAETGHYNYGPNFPGINTDAAGSYYPEEVRPTPQKYVADRRSLYTTRKPISPRVASPD